MADVEYASLISYLRHYGNAATDDVFSGVTYWTDDQLQEVLETNAERRTVRATCKNPHNLSLFSLDVSRWYSLIYLEIRTLSGVVISTPYVYDAVKNEILFDVPLSDSAISVHALVVNKAYALAELWDRKANQRTSYVNFRGGHNTMNMREEYEHCVKQREYYRGKIVRKWKRF